ncbi:MAG: hypothetical protein LBC55_08855 [Desulfovibrio sp.]|jgi:hypothetical protein|nr:hypothetical protein [Desulfovibrio sp.]
MPAKISTTKPEGSISAEAGVSLGGKTYFSKATLLLKTAGVCLQKKHTQQNRKDRHQPGRRAPRLRILFCRRSCKMTNNVFVAVFAGNRQTRTFLANT